MRTSLMQVNDKLQIHDLQFYGVSGIVWMILIQTETL